MDNSDKKYKKGQLVVELKAGSSVAYVTEKILIPLGAKILDQYYRFGIVVIEVPVGEEYVWISHLKQNTFIAHVSLNEERS